MTQTRFWLLSLSLAAGMGALDAQPAAACSCVRPSPCQDFNASIAPSRSDGADLSRVVFVGKVLKVQRDGDLFQHRLQVVRALKGISTPTADVWSSADACGLTLTVGARYVIYTWASNGRLSISQCSRIVRLAPGEPEPELPPVPGRVYGKVTRYDMQRLQSFKGLEPIPAVRVWLDLPSGRVSTRSDAWGRFTFADVPPGRYVLGFDAGPGLKPWHVEPLNFTQADACADTSLVLQHSGELSGQLLMSDRKPAPNVYLHLVDANRPDDARHERVLGQPTSDDGRFTFDSLKAGSYVLAVNPAGRPSGRQPYRATYFGGPDFASATRITIATDTPTRLSQPLVLPAPLPTRTFTIAVACRDGSKPMFHAQVRTPAGDRVSLDDAVGHGGGIPNLTVLRDAAYTLQVSARIPSGPQRPDGRQRRDEDVGSFVIRAGEPGRHLALVAPFSDCSAY